MKEKKIVPARRKNLNPIEEQIDGAVCEIANSTFGDLITIQMLKSILEKIQYCNEYKMYYVRDLAIARAIRRCDFEIEFSRTPCNDSEEEKLAVALAKKYDLT